MESDESLGESLVSEKRGANMAGRPTRTSLYPAQRRKKKSLAGKILKHELKKIWTGK